MTHSFISNILLGLIVSFSFNSFAAEIAAIKVYNSQDQSFYELCEVNENEMVLISKQCHFRLIDLIPAEKHLVHKSQIIKTLTYDFVASNEVWYKNDYHNNLYRVIATLENGQSIIYKEFPRFEQEGNNILALTSDTEESTSSYENKIVCNKKPLYVSTYEENADIGSSFIVKKAFLKSGYLKLELKNAKNLYGLFVHGIAFAKLTDVRECNTTDSDKSPAETIPAD